MKHPLYNHRWIVIPLVLICVSIAFFDIPIARAIDGLAPETRGLVYRWSQVGNSKWYLWPAGIGFLCLLGTLRMMPDGTRRRMIGWYAAALGFVFIAVAGSGILVNVFKQLFGRARPKFLISDGYFGFDPLVFQSGMNAFPSGHANTVLVVATILALLLPRYRALLLCIGGCFALLRVGANAHFLSDVIAGGLLGYLTTIWLRGMFARRGWVFVAHRDGRIRPSAPGRLLKRKIRNRPAAGQT